MDPTVLGQAKLYQPRHWILQKYQTGQKWQPENAMVITSEKSTAGHLPYTDEEYDRLLLDDQWTKDETDYLFQLCEQFGHRLLVVADRYGYLGKERSVEDVRERYYQVINKLSTAKAGSTVE